MKSSAFDVEVVAEAVVQPPLAELNARARRRVRRRRAIGTCIAVTLVAGALAAPGTRPDGGPPASGTRLDGAPAADPRTGEAGVFTDAIVIDQKTVVSVRWNACAVALSVTTDAGATWTPYRGPTAWVDCRLLPQTYFDVLGPRLFVADIRGDRYVSADAGVSWRRSERSFAVVDAVPTPAVPLERGAGPPFVDPTTGEFYQLARTGAITDVWSTRAATDGTLWMVGSAAFNRPVDVDQRVQVARSVDRGRTWQGTSPLPAMSAAAILVAASAQEAYLLGHQGGRAVMHRTVDGGQTWASTSPPWSRSLAATIGAHGALIVYADGPDNRAAWASSDGGRTFDRPAPAPALDARPARSGTGLLWIVTGDGSVQLTVDGRTWQRVPPPA